MIALDGEFSCIPSNMIEYQVTKDGRFGWFLATWHPEADHVLEEIQAQIKLEIKGSDIQSVSKLSIESWLKKFFADFHWKLHAQLRKTLLKEKGISLWFGVLFDHELFFVQFGRLICAVADNKRISPIGTSWQNYHVKSLEQLCLFGEPEKDIRVKTHRVFIGAKQKLIVVPSFIASLVFDADPEPSAISSLIESHAHEDNAQWLILEGRTKLLKPARRRINRLQITTMILLLISIITIVYMVFGNRFIDQSLRRLKLLFRENKNATWEQIPNYLNLDSSQIIKQLDKIVNLPARNIEFNIGWTTDLPYQITATPVFTIENLYLASDDVVLAYNKKSRELIWKLSMGSRIKTMTIARGSLILILDNNKSVALKDDGKLVWEYDLNPVQSLSGIRYPLELNNESDPRLDGSVILIAEEKGLSALDGSRGTALSKIDFKARLQYISAYDSFENCIYAVVADEVICIELNIRN